MEHEIEDEIERKYFYYPTGELHKEMWCNKNGYLHNNNGPAIIEYDIGGNKLKEEWYYIGYMFNCEHDKPYKKIYENGKLSYEYWGADGLYHREGAPAILSYIPNGEGIRVFSEKWIYLNRTHNLSGPAFVCYDSSLLVKNFKIELYYIYDKELNINKFYRYTYFFKRYIYRYKYKKRNQIIRLLDNKKLFDKLIQTKISLFCY